MPQLQMHQYRVAAVANMICDNFEDQIDKKAVISAALLHDMGNIVKFNLPLYPDHLEPEGLDYWEDIKKSFINKYGSDDHQVTKEIVSELGLGKKVNEIIGAMGFINSVVISETDDYTKKIVLYADCRVAIYGITSMLERIKDGLKRYELRKKVIPAESKIFKDHMQIIEDQIFSKCKITPTEITDASIEPYLHTLTDFQF